MIFINLEKAHDRVPREILKWALMKKSLPKACINIIEDMYEVSNTKVKSLVGKTEDFRAGVREYHGSALSPNLFSLVIDKITKRIQGEVPWCMLFADDIVLIGESEGGELYTGRIKRSTRE
ncbi:uncharacterized protein FWK35_00003122 [Aphis craccivora]|uniref:Reverse transcriptase domain-containing protein n=1 Tax=Aphis craccivora TaxID=307492 RepID=A0A6G0Z2E2_APHCR|nr:uncharacterized protein FWK35_00003122 [Aphis craccivora]